MDICDLHDTDIAQTPGVGIKSLKAIRAAFPFNYEKENRSLKEVLRRTINENKKLRERKISLGTVHNVTSVRFSPRASAILIKTSEHDNLFKVDLVWSSYVERKSDFNSFGFGALDCGDPVAVGVLLPKLMLVEEVTVTDPEPLEGYVTCDLIIRTSVALFKIDLFCDR